MIHKSTKLIDGYLRLKIGSKNMRYNLKGLTSMIKELDGYLHTEPLNHSPYECLYRYLEIFQREIFAGRITNFQYLTDNVFAEEEIRVLKDFTKKYDVTTFGTSAEDWDSRRHLSAVADFLINCKASGKRYSGTVRAGLDEKEVR